MGLGQWGISIMKTENRNVEQYVAPEMIQINIAPEGILCASNGEDAGLDEEL